MLHDVEHSKDKTLEAELNSERCRTSRQVVEQRVPPHKS